MTKVAAAGGGTGCTKTVFHRPLGHSSDPRISAPAEAVGAGLGGFWCGGGEVRGHGNPVRVETASAKVPVLVSADPPSARAADHVPELALFAIAPNLAIPNGRGTPGPH